MTNNLVNKLKYKPSSVWDQANVVYFNDKSMGRIIPGSSFQKDVIKRILVIVENRGDVLDLPLGKYFEYFSIPGCQLIFFDNTHIGKLSAGPMPYQTSKSLKLVIESILEEVDKMKKEDMNDVPKKTDIGGLIGGKVEYYVEKYGPTDIRHDFYVEGNRVLDAITIHQVDLAENILCKLYLDKLLMDDYFSEVTVKVKPLYPEYQVTIGGSHLYVGSKENCDFVVGFVRKLQAILPPKEEPEPVSVEEVETDDNKIILHLQVYGEMTTLMYDDSLKAHGVKEVVDLISGALKEKDK